MKQFTGDSRTDAAIILEAVLRENERSTDLANLAARAYAEPRDFALLRELVGGVLRRRMALLKIVGAHVSRGLDSTRPLLREILLCHAYQAVFLDRVPAHARVSGAVNAARRIDGEKGAGFVNAVTRSVERAAGDNPARLLDPLSQQDRLSIPDTFVRQIEAVEGPLTDWAKLESLATPSPLAVRIPRNPELRAQALQALSSAECVGAPGRYAADCIVVDSGRILASDAIGRLIVPQDEASQLVVQALDPLDGERVMDLCCGTGIKTSQIMDVAPGCEILAVDTDTRKLDRNKALCRSLGLGKPRVMGADATTLTPELDGTFDAVLLDAPCTGAGTIRRRPEVRYVRTAADFERAATLQIALLRRALDLVKPGGRLVYATCSFSPVEGGDVINAALADRPGFALEPTGLPVELESPDHTVTTLPWRHDMDGFFIARIRRSR